jgi:pimeloyl-ACP methyl ester carboxylesterase
MAYKIEAEMINGVERITYRPDNPKFQTPLLFQHGAWHGAWCWQYWQELFAEWGWVSHAHSLSGHGKSEAKRPVRLNTISMYRDSLKAQVDLCERPPVVIGHSMGGMITQWYLSHLGDLPAAVLLASMRLYDYPWHYFMLDPLSMSIALLSFHGYPFVRSPKHVQQLFLSEGALISAEDLHAKMDDESLLVTLVLTPLTWHPRKNPKTPVLVMAAEKDTIFAVSEEEALAKHYGGDFYLIKDTAHNAMMEKTYQQSAKYLHDWLVAKGIS